MNQTIKQRELQNCNTVKTLMMLMVVICHSASACLGKGWFVVGPDEKNPVMVFIACFTGMYHVQTFMFVSGYLFYYLKYELGKYSDPIEFVKKKAFRLLAPYLFACLWVIPAYIYFFKPDISHFVRRFVICENPSQLWFLLALFWIYIGFYFFSKLLDRFGFIKKMSFPKALLLLAFFFGLGFSSYVIRKVLHLNPFSVFTALKYSPVFCAGFIFRKYDFEKLHKFSIPLIAVSVAATTVYTLSADSLVKTFFQIPLWVFNSTAAFVFITKYVNLKGRFFETFRKYNFTIYLIHQQAIYVIIYLIYLYWNIYPYPSFIICLAGSLGISVALSAVFAKIRPVRNILGLKSENKQ